MARDSADGRAPMAVAAPAYGHAIVVGGSLAGLWAARVLADHFARVTIVDRDRFPADPSPRRGVPQARHVHLLLIRGQRIGEALFPGLTDELAAAGAPAIDWTADCLSHNGGRWAPRFQSGLVTRTCSRDLLEWTIRRRVVAHDRVRLLEGQEVIEALPGPAGSVVGVRVRPYGQAETPTERGEPIEADLVVDASGRDSPAPRWLADLGYGPVAETTITPFLGYASRWYRRPASAGADWQSLIISNEAPRQPRGGVIYPVEDDRWLVTLGGTARDYPPTDEDGFLAFARGLDRPTLYEAIVDAQPLSSVRGYRRTDNRLRHFERLTRWPDGFVALGDAVCAFNPIYGQGMTVSALGALVLGDCLAEQRRRPDGDLVGLARRFQHRLAATNRNPWLLATSEDFRWPTTEGGRPGWPTRLMHRYLDQVNALVGESAPVKRVFVEVLHLIAPPTALFRPAVLLPVLGRAGRSMLDRRTR